MFSDTIPTCSACATGVVKPDIVFFGESLPKRYFELAHTDLPQADLLLVFGTSLKVQPFASLVRHVADSCPRVLVNRERVGEAYGDDDFQFQASGGFVFDGPGAYRDVFCEGDVQESVLRLADLCGWRDELDALIKAWDDANKSDGGGEQKKDEAAAAPAPAAAAPAAAAAAVAPPADPPAAPAAAEIVPAAAK